MRIAPILKVRFYRTGSGREPVREFLRDLSPDWRRKVGTDIKEAQFGWPLGMPLVRKLERDLWEVRTQVDHGIVRTLFTLAGHEMVLLHIFVKKTQATPLAELNVARARLRDLQGEQ